MLVGILHQSEQLLFARQEFLSPGCTWQCRNLSPSCLPFSPAPKSAAELAPAFKIFFLRARLLLSAALGPLAPARRPSGCRWLSTALLTPLSSPAYAVRGKAELELLKGNGIMWYSWLAGNLLVGRRISSRFRKPASCHGLNKFSSIFQNKKSPRRGCLIAVFWWKVYVCLRRHFLQICQWPSYSSGCVGRCKTTVLRLLLTCLLLQRLFDPAMYLEQRRKHENWDESEPDCAVCVRPSACTIKATCLTTAPVPPPVLSRRRGTCVYKGAFVRLLLDTGQMHLCYCKTCLIPSSEESLQTRRASLRLLCLRCECKRGKRVLGHKALGEAGVSFAWLTQ